MFLTAPCEAFLSLQELHVINYHYFALSCPISCVQRIGYQNMFYG